MNNSQTNRSNVRIGFSREHLTQLSKMISGDACWVLIVIAAKLKQEDMNIIVSLQEMLESFPDKTDDLYQGLDELKKKNVIREIKSQSEIKYSINQQVLPTIYVDI